MLIGGTPVGGETGRVGTNQLTPPPSPDPASSLHPVPPPRLTDQSAAAAAFTVQKTWVGLGMHVICSGVCRFAVLEQTRGSVDGAGGSSPVRHWRYSQRD